MSKSLRLAGGVLLLLLCCGTWLAVATDYGDSVAVGKYRFAGNGETSTLVLKPDHSFQQDLQIGNTKQHGEGTWRRLGEGGIAFSKEFLIVSGDEPGPDGTTYSDMHKALGLFLSLRLRQYHVLWYGKTHSGSDNSIQGTYTGDEEGVPAELILKADHSFEQTVTHDGIARHASGTWSQAPDGMIRFSNTFLKTFGESLKTGETASTVGGTGPDLQIEIAISGQVEQPVFRKRLAPW
jgi:hypothetical protein